MAEQDIDAQIAVAVAGKKEEEKEPEPKLCVWSQGKVFEFPANCEAVVSADHQYLEITLEVVLDEALPLAKEKIVLGGFLGLWGYKWR